MVKLTDASVVDSWRLVCDGFVLDHIQPRLGEEFVRSILGSFRDNLVSAVTDPDWTFTGYGCRDMSADEWLRGHEERLCFELRGRDPEDFVIVAPNTFVREYFNK